MKKLFAMVLALSLCIGLMAGCAKDEPQVTPDPKPSAGGEVKPDSKPDEPKPNEPAKPKEPFVYYWTRSSEESVLSPHDSNESANYNVVDRTAGMLYFLQPSDDGQRSVLKPNLALGEPTVAADNVTWTIKLNPEAKWENGEKIDAHTFEYTFRRLLDPNLFWKVAGPVAKGHITIKNADAYYRQEATGVPVKWEDVGIKAVSDSELQIVTEGRYTVQEVMRHFYLRNTGAVYEPIYEKCISADGKSCDYGTSLDKLMCAGPFKIESWKKGSEIVFLKNEQWVHQDLIHIDKIISRVVTDEATRLELFEKGLSDSVGLGTNGMAKYGEDPRVLVSPTKTINTLEVNQNNPEKPCLQDPTMRKALFYAIDRNAIAKLNNAIPAPYFLSTEGQMLSDGTMYRDLPQAQELVPENGGYDPELANKLLDEMFQKYNLTHLDLNIIYAENSDGRRLASEFIQSGYKDVFQGKVTVKLEARPSKVVMADMRASRTTPASDWDMGWSGIGLAAESNAPWRKFERYLSTNASAYGHYTNEVVNTLYPECLKEENRLDEDKMVELTVTMEKAIMDDMTCIPVYQGTNHDMYNERIQLPVQKNLAGFGYGWIYSTLKEN